MKYIVLFLTLLAVLAISPVSNAANIAAGKEKAIIICAACHGDAGVSPNDDWPNLAGQKNGYLIKQIKAFRDGERVAPLMAPMVRSLTDTDVDNIAAYYSSLK